MKSVLAAVALALSLGVGAVHAQAADPAASAAAFQTTTLNLSAYGEVRTRPDMATITLGVTAQAPTAAAAMARNREAMSAALNALRAQGLADRDLQTSNLNLNAQYAYEDKAPPRLTGYEASNQVTVTVRDLARLGAVLDAAVASGANRINGISFGLSNPQLAEDQARRDAVRALAAKAQLYAQATGYGVRRLVSLSETGGYTPEPPRPMMAMASAVRFKEATPVEAGELKVRIDVAGLYELGR